MKIENVSQWTRRIADPSKKTFENDPLYTLDTENCVTEPVTGKWGDLLTIEEFRSNCEAGGFINYDGYGSYSDGQVVYPLIIYPSDFKTGKIIEGFSHVEWYNR